MVTFGMAITIPEEEMDLCRQLTRSAYIASALQNDIFSLEKELEVSRRQGHKNVVNAVWLMMRDHSITVNEARELCKAKIREHVAEYLRIIESVKDKLDVSLDLRTYLDAMLYTISGNVIWSIICPRYQYEASSSNPQSAIIDTSLEENGWKTKQSEKVNGTARRVWFEAECAQRFYRLDGMEYNI